MGGAMMGRRVPSPSLSRKNFKREAMLGPVAPERGCEGELTTAGKDANAAKSSARNKIQRIVDDMPPFPVGTDVLPEGRLVNFCNTSGAAKMRIPSGDHAEATGDVVPPPWVAPHPDGTYCRQPPSVCQPVIQSFLAEFRG